LQHHDLLMTIVQVSATFAGFSGIIGLFRRSRTLSDVGIGALQVRAVVEISLIATGLALLPFIPNGFGASETLTWRLCSAVAGVALFGGAAGAMRRLRLSTGKGPMATDPLSSSVALAAVGTSQVVLWLNAFRVTSGAAATFYGVALLLTLAHAGFVFVGPLIPRA